jgi:acetyltransferase-like isoleucine patch superfamily enzyme
MNLTPSLWKRAVLRMGRWHHEIQVQALLSRCAACGRNVSVQWPVVVNGADHLRIGDDVSINAFVHIWAQGGVSIGGSTLIASHVAITSLSHDPKAKTFSGSLVSKPVMIGSNVWIGSHAVVLPGVSIGDGAIVGAGAVVTRDVAPGDVVAGVPAAPIRTAHG